MQYIITEELNGMLLREYLLQHLRLSHRLITRLKQTPRGILLNDAPVTVRAVLKRGDVLVLATEDDERTARGHIAVGQQLPDILYEDDHIIVCNKPYGMPTHPSHGHIDDTLANALAHYETLTIGHPDVFRPIHRLDRDTSGVVLVARHQLAAARLSFAMRTGQIQKQYLAILDGRPPQNKGEIVAAIRRAEQSIITREICADDAPGAHMAHTFYQVISHWSDNHLPRTLVRAFPLTGRTHQLRLHFAHVGAPITGDSMYGSDRCDTAALNRHMLHAYSLRFPHPMTQQSMVVVAPLCENMRALLPSSIS